MSLTPVGAAGAKGYFVYTAHAGSRVSGQVSLVNTSAVRGTVLLYAVDATTGQTTGAVYQSRARRRHDVGAWTKLPIRRVVLGSHGRAQVSFRLRVPRGARGGQHLGAIVAQPVSPVRRYSTRKGSHAFHINVQALSVLAVQVNVPTRPVQRMVVNGCRAGGPHDFQTLFVGHGQHRQSVRQGHGDGHGGQGRRPPRSSTRASRSTPSCPARRSAIPSCSPASRCARATTARWCRSPTATATT